MEVTDRDIQSWPKNGCTPMLSSVLRSKRAIQVNIAIMRAFVTFRDMLSTHKELADKLAELEQKYDEKFRIVFDAIRQLMAQPTIEQQRRQIGFSNDDEGGSGRIGVKSRFDSLHWF